MFCWRYFGITKGDKCWCASTYGGVEKPDEYRGFQCGTKLILPFGLYRDKMLGYLRSRISSEHSRKWNRAARAFGENISQSITAVYLTQGRVGCRCTNIYMKGPCLAVSKPMFPKKGPLCSIFGGLQDWHAFAPLQIKKLHLFRIISQMFGKFSENT